MAGICTNVVRDSGGDCEHLTLTANLDGEAISIDTGLKDDRWSLPLDADEKRHLLRLLTRWWKGKGADITTFVGRVLAGEEGSNVKVYTFRGPGNTVAMTNMHNAGANTYGNVNAGLNGESIVVDFTGCTQFRPRLTANFVGTGPWQVRIIRDSDSTVFYESPSLTQTGERRLDPGWQSLPGGFTGLEELRVQAKSAVAADDPVFRCIELAVR